MAQATVAMIPSSPAVEPDGWAEVLDLACDLTVDLMVPSFKLANFVALQAQSVVATATRLGRDVPLRVNGQLIAWGEIEAVGGRMAVRVTALA